MPLTKWLLQVLVIHTECESKRVTRGAASRGTGIDKQQSEEIPRTAKTMKRILLTERCIGCLLPCHKSPQLTHLLMILGNSNLTLAQWATLPWILSVAIPAVEVTWQLSGAG